MAIFCVASLHVHFLKIWSVLFISKKYLHINIQWWNKSQLQESLDSLQLIQNLISFGTIHVTLVLQWIYCDIFSVYFTLCGSCI